MAVSVCTKLTEEKKGNVCLLCNSFAIDEQKYGCMYKLDDVIVHHYCVLLSTRMQQKGQDDEGILGFLLPDIWKEKKRAAKTTCDYCHLPGATVFCNALRCKAKFHVPCGVRNNCLNQFFGAFKSFCAKHRMEQKIPPHIIKEAKKAKPFCTICFEDVVAKASPNTLWAPCCSRNAWFHRKCIQSLAISAGYFFKCPLCNDKESFQKAMLNLGIYVPQQDASWETAPNAFHELLERHNTCDRPKCRCPKSRSYSASGTIWELILCSTCASQGIHIACGDLKFTTTEWDCPECTKTIKKAKASKRVVVQRSDDSSASEDSSSVPRKSRLKKKKKKKQKHKKLVDSTNSTNDKSPNSSSSPLGDSTSNVNVPDETADIIVLSSDDDLFEIVDTSKLRPPPAAAVEAVSVTISDEDSSDIDIVGDVPAFQSRLSLPKPCVSDEPTAVIRIHNSSGGVMTVPAASFKNTIAPLSSSHIPTSSPNVFLTLNARSDANQNVLSAGSSSKFCDNSFAVETQPQTSTSFINCGITASAPIPSQYDEPADNLPYACEGSSNDSSRCAPESGHFHSSALQSTAFDEYPPTTSFADLPPTSDEQLLRRYNHLGLKPLRVVIKPLEFHQIGKNRFLTIIPSQKKKRGRKPKGKVQLSVGRNGVEVKNMDKLGFMAKQKLKDCSHSHPLKKVIFAASKGRQIKIASDRSGPNRSVKASPIKIKQLSKPAGKAKASSALKINSPPPKSSPNPKVQLNKTAKTSTKVDSKKSPANEKTNKATKSEPSKVNVIENFFHPIKASTSTSNETLTGSMDGTKVEHSFTAPPSKIVTPRQPKSEPKTPKSKELLRTPKSEKSSRTPKSDKILETPKSDISKTLLKLEKLFETPTSEELSETPKSEKLFETPKSEKSSKTPKEKSSKRPKSGKSSKTSKSEKSSETPKSVKLFKISKLDNMLDERSENGSDRKYRILFKEIDIIEEATKNTYESGDPYVEKLDLLKSYSLKTDQPSSSTSQDSKLRSLFNKSESKTLNTDKSGLFHKFSGFGSWLGSALTNSKKLELKKNSGEDKSSAKTAPEGKNETDSEKLSKFDVALDESIITTISERSKIRAQTKTGNLRNNQTWKSPRRNSGSKISDETEKNMTSKFKGRLVPISLFDPPEVSEKKTSERVRQPSLDGRKSRRFSRELSKSNSLSRSESLDLSDGNKAHRSREKLEKVGSEEGGERSSSDKTSKKSSKTGLKRGSSVLKSPTSAKKARREIGQSGVIIPIFDFELTPPKPKKTKQNFRIGDESFGTVNSPLKSVSPRSEASRMGALSGDALIQNDGKNAKPFPKLISSTSDKIAKKTVNPSGKGKAKESPDVEKISPPINKFFQVLESSDLFAEKSDKPRAEVKLHVDAAGAQSCSDMVVSSAEKNKLAVQKESAVKPLAKPRNSNSAKTFKETKRDSKENIAMFKTDTKNAEKSHQTRITDFCSKSNAASMPLQPSKKFV